MGISLNSPSLILSVYPVVMLIQLSQMSSDYWLAYQTSDERNFVASLFIGIYTAIAVVSCVFMAIRSVLVAFLGLKTAQSFFNQILNSVLHAPMSFFDTTPSGRILSRASSDQVNIDILIPLFLSITIVMYFSLFGILVITCQYAWPTVFIIVPLIWLNIWYQNTLGCLFSYLPLNSVLYWTIYLGSVLENRMVSVERIKQFINIPSEAAWRKPDSPPSPDWPNRGEIEIKNLQVRYRHNTPLVLKGISLTINGGEKIGVVGRTGSGKSTLIQVFFRLLEPYAGTIIVDGIDICKLGLHDLRSRFGIIPQEPVLFEGTVRSNIDPLGLYSDDEIWKSLERCQLKEVVSAKPEKLDSSGQFLTELLLISFSLCMLVSQLCRLKITSIVSCTVVDSGDNWSVGQRQLLCLGRVMLKRSKILFMDEATASVDSQTDAVIQKIIRQDFSACTIITIAHRIPTVIDCDRVLVIDNGWAKEFDAPGRLLERPSLFGALVQEYANRSSGL
ncbi:UNVERIFIED_CONTAM: ABC transporter C family member 14 [Sesamum radiatum]|uniref:ABC-type xenobiotic transporter n=1 Tax=Sesamum radiatum TaxID=300843 RepID=A0AAW2S8F4_SESRA